MDATGMSGSTQEGTYAFPASHSIDPTSCSETILHLKERDLAIPFLLHMKTSLLFGTAFGNPGFSGGSSHRSDPDELKLRAPAVTCRRPSLSARRVKTAQGEEVGGIKNDVLDRR